MKPTLKQWSLDDQPREKFLLKGKEALSTAELLATLIGSGSKEMSAVDLSKHLLKRFNNDLNRLCRASISDLIKVPGIGEAKAISILAAFELGRRKQSSEIKSNLQIKSSNDAYILLSPSMSDLSVEIFKIILLNRNNRVMKIETISSGGVAGTVVDPKVIFKKALDHLACSVILAHNHPSGNLKPSQADISITKKLVKGGKAMDIKILDHLIITSNGYYSFTDEAIL